jgi:hypothetical protein
MKYRLVAEGEPAGSAPAEGGDLDARLGALIQQQTEGNALVGQVTKANEQLNERLSSLEQAITGLASQPPAAPAAPSAPEKDLFGNPAQPAKPIAPLPTGPALDMGQLHKMIESTVANAISPVTTKLQVDAQADALRAQQSAFYAQAAASMPALRDGGSPESALFDKIYKGQPELANLPQAPLLIAEMVRGLSVEANQKQAQRVERKGRAAVVNPGSSLNRVGLGAISDTEQAGEYIDALREKGEQKGWDSRDMQDYTELTIAKVLGEASA